MDTPIDERGHTMEQAVRQEPLLDPDAPAASQETPGQAGVPTGDIMVPAQTPEEVQAQIDNPAGGPDDEHGTAEQLEAAEGLSGSEELSDEDEDDEYADAADDSSDLDESGNDPDADEDEDDAE